MTPVSQSLLRKKVSQITGRTIIAAEEVFLIPEDLVMLPPGVSGSNTPAARENIVYAGYVNYWGGTGASGNLFFCDAEQLYHEDPVRFSPFSDKVTVGGTGPVPVIFNACDSGASSIGNFAFTGYKFTLAPWENVGANILDGITPTTDSIIVTADAYTKDTSKVSEGTLTFDLDLNPDTIYRITIPHVGSGNLAASFDSIPILFNEVSPELFEAIVSGDGVSNVLVITMEAGNVACEISKELLTIYEVRAV